MKSAEQKVQTKELTEAYDYLAPDKSEIRLLPSMTYGGMAHCTLPPGMVSDAVKHKTVEEIWYVISGHGEIWRKNDSDEEVTPLQSGTSISIPVGTEFQFRNLGEDSLRIIIATMPPWPGSDEAISVSGYWH